MSKRNCHGQQNKEFRFVLTAMLFFLTESLVEKKKLRENLDKRKPNIKSIKISEKGKKIFWEKGGCKELLKMVANWGFSKDTCKPKKCS